MPVGAGLCILLASPSPQHGSSCAHACRVLALKPGPRKHLPVAAGLACMSLSMAVRSSNFAAWSETAELSALLISERASNLQEKGRERAGRGGCTCVWMGCRSGGVQVHGARQDCWFDAGWSWAVLHVAICCAGTPNRHGVLCWGCDAMRVLACVQAVCAMQQQQQAVSGLTTLRHCSRLSSDVSALGSAGTFWG